ncbi:MAG: hypothetical protein PHY16_14730 [Methylobacter sp.]|nr:hypothetical protein [Methylobacter sp.]
MTTLLVIQEKPLVALAHIFAIAEMLKAMQHLETSWLALLNRNSCVNPNNLDQDTAENELLVKQSLQAFSFIPLLRRSDSELLPRPAGQQIFLPEE